MSRESVPIEHLRVEPFTGMEPDGVLLVSGHGVEDANVMTIGWATFGIVWSRPVVMVMVRPTRHTWTFINEVQNFTVNWLSPERREALQLCGSTSGRELDKFAAANLRPIPASVVTSPVLADSVLALECRTVYTDDVKPDRFVDEALQRHYTLKDYHRLFFGQIVAASRKSPIS